MGTCFWYNPSQWKLVHDHKKRVWIPLFKSIWDLWTSPDMEFDRSAIWNYFCYKQFFMWSSRNVLCPINTSPDFGGEQMMTVFSCLGELILMVVSKKKKKAHFYWLLINAWKFSSGVGLNITERLHRLNVYKAINKICKICSLFTRLQDMWCYIVLRHLLAIDTSFIDAS